MLHSSFTISASDVVIFEYNFRAAAAGDADNPSGTDGYFEFRVTPPNTNASAYSSGTIVATSYNDVANEQLTINNEQLRAWTQNGTLHVGGLTAGKPWSVYSLNGQLIYRGIATGDRAEIPLPGKGIFIIADEKESIKTVFSFVPFGTKNR